MRTRPSFVRVALILGIVLAAALVIESLSAYHHARVEMTERSTPPSLTTHELQRSLEVAIATSVALLGALIVVLVALPAYVRGRELERQVAVARQVQHDMLPQDLRPGPGVELGMYFEPAWEVGGDLFDIFPAAGNSTALALGDVAGKGLPASLLMALTHGVLRSAAGELSAQTLAPLVSRLNLVLCEATPPNRFATLFAAVVDAPSRHLSWVNAGHLPALLVRGGGEGNEIERLRSTGPVVGALPYATYRCESTTLHCGDLLAIYSDGVTEAVSPSEEEFGEARLCAILTAMSHRPCQEIVSEIVRQVRAFAPGSPADDLTILVLRIPSSDSSS
ncbi:MAG: PP2C family protein-serine/threonine phosphatase [Thermoanaerobaculaceae bacterium]|nr:PP2C family protein-serine/threonine phosphatase [Thermoanaerobaculaceae bacterium]MDI9621829.1 PP2C family protein-serine/threonine phosphatase [Acidobacteriota bacterium]HPW54456.1 PP2C family protein-serine/threonine phosphatase [Thermoanaerobaculaceae bacterium]